MEASGVEGQGRKLLKSKQERRVASLQDRRDRCREEIGEINEDGGRRMPAPLQCDSPARQDGPSPLRSVIYLFWKGT